MTRRIRRPRTAALAALVAAATVTTGLAATQAQAAPKAPALSGDFNGDGRRDVALGSPFGTAAGVEYAGFVTVVYGGASGPDTAERQMISQSSPGIPGGSEEYDEFGASLASADFNLDGYADLAVVAPGEDNDGPITGGQITLIYGSESGLSEGVRFGDGAVTVSAGDFDHDGKPDLAAGRAGGFAVYRDLASGDLSGKITTIGQGEGEIVRVYTTAGDFTGDGYADLGLGIVWNPIDGDDAWVRLDVYKGSADGVSETPASSDPETRATSLTAGDTNGDGRADLIAGTTREEIKVYPGTSSGVGTPTVIDEDTEGVPDGSSGDFGASVAAGDVNGDGRADIAVGVPGPASTTTDTTGAVTVLYGGPDGVSGAGAQQFTQNSDGVPGGSEQGDHFGSGVGLADLNGDGKSDLTAGTEGENDGEGAVYILNGTASGVTTTGVQAFGSAAVGVEGLHAELGGVILP